MYTFDHGAGTSDWSNSLNWNPDGVPGTGDDAIIPHDGVVLSSGAASIHRLEIDADTNTGLTIDGAATSLTLGTGTSFFDHGLALQNGATLNLGTSTTWHGGVVGACSGTPQCTVNIGAGGTLNITADVIAGNGGYWHNLGTVTVSTPNTTDLRGAFENDGLVQIQQGRVQIGGDGATHQTDGAYTVASGGILMVGGDMDFAAGSSVSGAGRVDVNYRTAHFLAGSSLTPGGIDMTGGTLDNSIAVSVPSFTANGGALVGSGALTVTGAASFLLSNLQVRGTGGLNLEGTTTVTNGFTLDPGATVNLGPLTTWTGGSIGGCLNGVGTCTIAIGPGDVLDIQGNLNAFDNGGTVWNNQGTIMRSSGTGVLTYAATLNNTGTVDLRTGTLQAAHYSQSAGTTRLASGTAFTGDLPLQGGSLTGTGTVSGNVTNSGGTVAPGSSPGHLTISGNYTQGAGGHFAEDIAGVTQGSDYDWLSVTGNVSLAGQLAIASSYTPAATDAFDVITAGGVVSGAFDSLSGNLLSDRRYYASYLPAGVRLTVQAAATNASPPSVAGRAGAGQTLTCDPGTWSGPVTIAYSWLRDGAAIATGASYRVVDADAGHTLVCRVTGTDANGSNTVDSAGIAIPVPTTAPTGLPPECNLPTQPATPAPVLYRFVVIRPLRSGVTYQLPGCPVQVGLDRALLIPVNTIVDTTRGRILLTSARPRARTQSITLYAGAFVVRQRRTDKPAGMTEFGLAGNGLPVAGKAVASKRKQPNLKAVRRLWADGSGAFRTRGGFASAAIRGTKWLTIDRFNTTVIRVVEGAVLVRDLLRNANVVVRAGEVYEARATSMYLNKVRTNPRYGKRYSVLRTRHGVFHIYRNGRRIKVG